MFNSNKNNYSGNTKQIQIQTHRKDNFHNFTLIVSNLLAISFLTYFVFFYMKNEVNLLSEASIPAQAVLGVSETIEQKPTVEEEYAEYAPNTMKVIMYDKVIQSEPSYSEGIARELDDKSGVKGRIVLVNDEKVVN